MTKRSLHEQVQFVLDADPLTKRLRIRVENDAGAVVLRGTVATYHQKQMAQQVIKHVLDVLEPHPVLRNLIEVMQKEPDAGQ